MEYYRPLAKRTIAPSPFLTAADLRAHSRLPVIASETAYIEGVVLTAAVGLVENFLERALMPQTWKAEFPLFCDTMILPFAAPLAGVTSVKYYDGQGVQNTFDPTSYWVNKTKEPGRINTVAGLLTPFTQPRPDAVEVIYTAGYATAADIPAEIKLAVLQVAASLFENREAVAPGKQETIPYHICSLLNPYRVRVL